MSSSSTFKAAFLGGLLAAVASSVPFVSLLCCVWAMGGGAFAAWVVISDSEGRAGSGRCAWVGLLSGLIGGAICAPLSGYVNQLVTGPEKILEQAEQVTAMFGSSSDQFSPDMMESIVRGTSFIELNAWSLIAVLMTAVGFSFLGLLGGLLGGAIFGRNAVAAVPAPAPLAPPTLPSAGVEAPSDEHGELEVDELPELPARDDEDA